MNRSFNYMHSVNSFQTEPGMFHHIISFCKNHTPQYEMQIHTKYWDNQRNRQTKRETKLFKFRSSVSKNLFIYIKHAEKTFHFYLTFLLFHVPELAHLCVFIKTFEPTDTSWNWMNIMSLKATSRHSNFVISTTRNTSTAEYYSNPV